MATVNDLFEKLGLAGFSPTEAPVSSARQLKLHGRVDKSQSTFWARAVIRDLLRASSSGAWALDASKQMVLVKGETYYRWRLIFQDSVDVSRHLEEIVNVVSMTVTPDSRRMGREVVEMPLVGSPSTRNNPINGKGAVEAK